MSSLCTVTPPLYGVAASSVAWKSSTGGSLLLDTSTGLSELVGQKAHGALCQALFQARNGAFAYTFSVSRCQVFQSRGHLASRHWTVA